MKECSGKAEVNQTKDPIVGEVYEDKYDGQLYLCTSPMGCEFVALTGLEELRAGTMVNQPGMWKSGNIIHKPNACICKDGCGK
jgi:hypothetical protein